jgi:hypothetical protein
MKNLINKMSALFAVALFAGAVACQPASDGSDSATNTQPLEETETPATATTPDPMEDTATVSTDSLSNPTVPN